MYCISLQLGATLAVQLFDDGGTWGTAALRLLMAAAVLLLISRPKVRTWGREQWLAAAVLGLSLGMMNGFFYAAIARIPIGPAVTIEFIGPLLLAAFLPRSLRDAVGVGLVLVAGACWAAYILASKKAGSLNPNVFSILVALEPVFAAFFGWLLLSQNVSPLKLLAIALVIMASVLQTMVPARGTKRKLRRVPWKAHRRSRAKVG